MGPTLRFWLIEAGSFTGAILGGALAVAAAGSAWLGVKSQIDEQRISNRIAIKAILYTDLERINIYSRNYLALELACGNISSMISSHLNKSGQLDATFITFIYNIDDGKYLTEMYTAGGLIEFDRFYMMSDAARKFHGVLYNIRHMTQRIDVNKDLLKNSRFMDYWSSRIHMGTKDIKSVCDNLSRERQSSLREYDAVRDEIEKVKSLR